MNDLFFLASDSLQGRKTNSEGNEIARKYIIQEITKIRFPGLCAGFIPNHSLLEKDTIPAVNILGFYRRV